MSNYMDDDDSTDFRDIPDEVNETNVAPGQNAALTEMQAANAIPTRRVFPSEKTVDLPSAPEQEYEEETEEVEDYTDVLSDARLRLEQGNLYSLVMNNDLFGDSDCDPRAIKNVEKEIRQFAKERMEIMLGMRQEIPKESSFPMESFPFNALEVEVLKSLALAATKGASADAEPFVGPSAPPKKNTLNPISVRSNQTRPAPKKQEAKPLPTKAATPVKRAKTSEAIQRILDEEGVTLEEINQVFDPNQKYLTPDEMARLTPEQMAERNRQSAARLNKTVPSRQAAPMPSQEHIDAMYASRANQAAANPQMQMIMNLLDKKNK